MRGLHISLTMVLLSLAPLLLPTLAGCGKVVYGDLDAAPRDQHKPDRDPFAPDAATACPTWAPCLVTVAGSGMSGSSDGPALQAKFNLPNAVAMGYKGEVIVVDYGNSVLRKIKGGQVSIMAGSVWGNANGPLPKAMFAYPEGISSRGTAFYLADTKNHSIREVTLTQVGPYAGSDRGFVEGPAASAKFDEPCALTHHSSGAVYVADRKNNVIRKIEKGKVSTLIGDAKGAAGDKNGPAGSALLNGPSGLAVDDAGKLYIADTDNNKIKVYDPSSGSVHTLAGDGYHGYMDGKSGLISRFAEPVGLAVTPDGATVYVADAGNHCIRKIAADPVGGVSTVAGKCTQAGFVDGSATVKARLDTPRGLTLTGVKGSAVLYIADSKNHSVRLLIPK